MMKRLISLMVIISHFMLVTAPAAAAIREEAVCRKLSYVCVDGPSTKNINGVEITKDCWEYKAEYQCLEKDPADYCAPLKKPEAKCEVQGQNCLEKSEAGECLRYTHQYSCDVDLKTLHNGRLPEKVEELEHTHAITTEWDESSCHAKDKKCKIVSKECVEPGSTKVINGVPVTRECWKEQRTMQCMTGDDADECSAYDRNKNCKLIEDKCTHKLPDGTCQARDKQYECIDSPETTREVSSCKDQDFARTISAMEMARESQRFYDSEKQQFFKGEPDKCSIKLGGALDGVFGGDCCKTDADPAKMIDFVVQAGTEYAAKQLLSSVASHYTYTLLQTNAPQFLTTALSAAGLGGSGASAAAGGAAAGGPTGLSAFGFTAGIQGGQLVVTFDPVSFAIAIAIMALQQWLKCDQKEILVAMKRKADLCHYIGSYCSSKALGGCVTKMETQCCYISKLTKIVNVQGKAQLGRGWGTPENPSCEGFTAQDLEKIDFSKMDLAGFYDDVYANMANVSKQSNHAIAGAVENIKKGSNEVKNYYDQ